jgi:hypothetical protein
MLDVGIANFRSWMDGVFRVIHPILIICRTCTEESQDLLRETEVVEFRILSQVKLELLFGLLLCGHRGVEKFAYSRDQMFALCTDEWATDFLEPGHRKES